MSKSNATHKRQRVTVPGLSFHTSQSFVLLFLGRCFNILCPCPSLSTWEQDLPQHTLPSMKLCRTGKIRSADSNDCGPESLHQS